MSNHGTSMSALLQQVHERTTVGPKVKVSEDELTDPTATGDEPALLKGLIKKPKKKDKGDGEITINPTQQEGALRAQDRGVGTDSLVQAYREDTPGQSENEVEEDRDAKAIEAQALDYQQRQSMHRDARGLTRPEFVKKYRADAQAGDFHDSVRGKGGSRKKSKGIKKEKSQTHSEEVELDEIKTPRGEKRLPRQLKDPEKEMMVFHPTVGVKVINRDKWEYHRKKGFSPAEEYEHDGIMIDESAFAELVEKTAENIVKGMKKNKSYFDKKYGDRADAIMYATANKLATEHVINEKGHPTTSAAYYKEKQDAFDKNRMLGADGPGPAKAKDQTTNKFKAREAMFPKHTGGLDDPDLSHPPPSSEYQIKGDIKKAKRQVDRQAAAAAADKKDKATRMSGADGPDPAVKAKQEPKRPPVDAGDNVAVSTPPAARATPSTREKVKATAANTKDYDKTLALQKSLRAKGAKIKADGLMGPNTRAAMKKYSSAAPVSQKPTPKPTPSQKPKRPLVDAGDNVKISKPGMSPGERKARTGSSVGDDGRTAEKSKDMDWSRGTTDRMGKKLKYPHGYNQKTGKKLKDMEGGLRMKKFFGRDIEVDSRDSAYDYKQHDESKVDVYADFISDQIKKGIQGGHLT